MDTVTPSQHTAFPGNSSGRSGPRIYGVDFSGASDAGRRIWIAGGSLEGGVLRIQSLIRGDRIEGSGRTLSRCLCALGALIAKSRDSIFGLDFCFSLPLDLIDASSWYDFISKFPERFTGPQAFRASCRRVAPGSELKRVTDIEQRTPFSPYNLRIYRQTFYGIREVLHPLVTTGRAVALPMQEPLPGKPRLVEVCPASLLKARSLYVRYKGKTKVHQSERARVIDTLEERNEVTVASTEHRRMVLENHGGDALDSLLAAVCAARALSGEAVAEASRSATCALEGYVYI